MYSSIFKLTAFFLAWCLLEGCSPSSCQSSKPKATNGDENNGVLRIGTNANYPPFESMNQDSQMEGFDIDIGRALGEVLGKKVIFQEFDFDALLLALKNGQIDLIISGMSITESRQKEIAMIPYQGKPIKALSFLFWDSVSPELDSIEKIAQRSREEKKPVTVQSGHFLHEYLKSVPGLVVESLSGPPEQILGIKFKKSFAAVLDPHTAQDLKAKHNELQVLTLPLPPEKWDLGKGIGIKKDRKDLIESVEKAIQTLKANGTIEQLTQKWLKDQ